MLIPGSIAPTFGGTLFCYSYVQENGAPAQAFEKSTIDTYGLLNIVLKHLKHPHAIDAICPSCSTFSYFELSIYCSSNGISFRMLRIVSARLGNDCVYLRQAVLKPYALSVMT